MKKPPWQGRLCSIWLRAGKSGGTDSLAQHRGDCKTHRGCEQGFFDLGLRSIASLAMKHPVTFHSRTSREGALCARDCVCVVIQHEGEGLFSQ